MSKGLRWMIDEFFSTSVSGIWRPVLKHILVVNIALKERTAKESTSLKSARYLYYLQFGDFL